MNGKRERLKELERDLKALAHIEFEVSISNVIQIQVLPVNALSDEAQTKQLVADLNAVIDPVIEKHAALILKLIRELEDA